MYFLEASASEVAMLLGGLGAFIVLIMGAFGSMLVSLSNGRKLNTAVGKTEEIHKAVNSNLDKLRYQFYGVVAMLLGLIGWVFWERNNRRE